MDYQYCCHLSCIDGKCYSQLTESMRAHGDPDFCEIQNVTCMSSFQLKGNVDQNARFKSLCWSLVSFIESWDDVLPDVTRMCAWHKLAQEALEEHVNACRRQSDTSETQYIICYYVDLQGHIGSQAEMSQAMSNSPIVRYLDGN
jgi:hypothetical protein